MGAVIRPQAAVGRRERRRSALQGALQACWLRAVRMEQQRAESIPASPRQQEVAAAPVLRRQLPAAKSRTPIR